jgi:membrane-associated protease RseP (regulator of RpoE activity)
MLTDLTADLTYLVVLIALGFLGWGFYRARPFGKFGILAWLQSVVLMVPWLLFFGLAATGIYLNLAGVLVLFLISTGFYIFLGNRLRSIAKEQAIQLSQQKPTSLENGTGNGITQAEQERGDPVTPATEIGMALKPEIVPIPAEDLQSIRSIFGIDTFFATETIPYQDGAIFKGNLRGEVDASYQRLSEGLQERMGDRYRLFLVEGPESKPVVIVLPSTSDPKPTSLPQKVFAGILLLATIATCLETGGLLQGFDLSSNLSRYGEALPIGLGILAVLGVHELAHRLMAQRHQVRLSPPFLIPAWQLGSFGGFTRFESLLPNRSALFDIAFAGPAAGGLLSLLMVIVGFLLSHPGSQFQVPSPFFQGSILVGTLARVVLGTALQNDLVDVHPLVIVGWLGLVITALNLMPAGQLDGGRVVQAIYGRKIAGWTRLATIVVLALVSLLNPLALYWAIVILFLQRELERPTLNELSEPDDARAALGLLALFLMVATLLPLTPSLAGRLGIGG